MHATGFTMVKPKRPGGKSPSPLKPVIGAFLDLSLGPGFAAFPDLIDKDTVEKSILQLRQTFYFEALKVVTKANWNRYIHFGFQQFAFFNTNSFVTFLSWIYWLGTHAFNAAGHMGALL
jgi:hypothetical protein